MSLIVTELASVERLSRDVRDAAASLSDREARFLVDQYYAFQEDRLRSAGRVRAMSADNPTEPHAVVQWLEGQSGVLENQIKGALDRYSKAHPIGRWMRSYKGIGPVISAGYLANIDIERANTAGKLWAYCGLAPGKDKRKKGEKLIFNPSLKRLSWILGESFMKVSGDPGAYYAQLYRQRKAYETAKNEAGAYAAQAAETLAAKKFKDDTVAKTFYEKGQLPPARINLRAQRWAVKLFLSHLQETWWRHRFGTAPPAPYAMAHAGHADYIPVPPPDRDMD
jgi:hypothetical protein